MSKGRASWLTASALSTILVLGGCSSSGGGDTAALSGSTSEATTISGKVTLSGVVAGKPGQRLQKMAAVPKGKPGSALYKATAQKAHGQKYDFLPTRAASNTLANAIVYLYDANHPEWLWPVAQTTTDSDGNYTLDTLANAAKNGDAYRDGDPIPAGKYTLMAYGVDPVTLKPSIALESVVQEFTGDVQGEELVAQDSTAAPEVLTMVGVKKNTDGTQTWGGPDLVLPPNAAIQVTFSMAMNRASVQDGIEIQPPVDGQWAVSADWLSATFYPADGVSLAPGQYTVTVYGEDQSDTPVRNVYGNALEKTATATFTVAAEADTTPPTVTLASPADGAADVDITTPIRVRSDEPLDVNTLRLQATPSLGAQPGVMFIGSETDDAGNTHYIYEFMLGEPLQLGQTYQIDISEGADLAGNPMAPISASFTTAQVSDGIDPESETAADQAEVKDVFGRWIRALDDRNLAQVTALMAGDFIMEYDTKARDGFDLYDINRDGAWDLAEFGDMLSTLFPLWDYCGTTVTGEIVGTINVVAGESADFEFKLIGDSELNTQDCAETTPRDSLFVTLNRINERWVIVRASEGIDTRGQPIRQAGYLTLVAPEDGFVMDPNAPDAPTNELGEPVFNFQWEPVDDAAAYVMIFFDAREPRSGFAFILPPTFTDMDIPPAPSLFEGNQPVAVDVSKDFGFDRPFDPRPGSDINWQVAALGSNTVADVHNGRNTDLARDVIAISELRHLKIAGQYVEMRVAVKADSNGDGTQEPLTFNELFYGYDAGSASQLTLEITSYLFDPVLAQAVADGTAPWNGLVRVSGYTYQEYPITFGNIVIDAATGLPMGTATVIVDLNQDWNWIEIVDRFDPTNPEVELGALRRDFNVVTTAGLTPAIDITGLTDQDGNTLTDQGWNYYEALGATQVTVTGTIDTSLVDTTQEIRLNLWNDLLGATESQVITPDASGAFSVTLNVYQGDNWVDISAAGVCDASGFCPWYSVNFGVYTDAGSTYTPPIEITLVEGKDPGDGLVVKNETWPNGANYDASAVTSNTVVIEGTFNNLDPSATPSYDVGSDGGWESGSLYVAADGSFRLVIDLYNGWNYVNLTDGQSVWYTLSLYTSAGKQVVRPQITHVNNSPYTGADVTTSSCAVTIQGTAEPGPVYVYWNGNDGQGNFYWEDLSTTATDSDGDGLGEFSVVVPLVSSTDASGNVVGDNFIDINDAQYRWTGVRVIPTAECPYTPPTMTVDGIEDPSGTALPEDPNLPGQYDAGANNEVVLFGTHSDMERTIRVRQWVCGQEQVVSTQTGTQVNVDGSYDWRITVPLYDAFVSLEVTDGVNFQTVQVMTSAPQQATPVMAVSSVEVTQSNDATLTTPAALGSADNQGCDYADYVSDPNLAQATEVTITGTTQSGAGTGQYNGSVVNGSFTITDADNDGVGEWSLTVPLYDGLNFVTLCDTAWNCVNLSFQTSNGVNPPAYVEVTSPAAGAAVSGDVTVSGTITLDADGDGVDDWTPDVVMANVDWCDVTGVCQFISFSSDPNAASWGAQALTYDTATQTFQFTIPGVPADTPVNVNVFADDNDDPNRFISHGLWMVLNDSAATGVTYFKAGDRSDQVRDAAQRLRRQQALRGRGR